MLRRTILCGSIALLMLGTLSAAPAEKSEAPLDRQSRIRDLEQLLRDQLARNRELAGQLAEAKFEINDLRQKMAVMQYKPLNTTIPAQPEQRLPDGWQSRQFNGVQFYLVPLGAQSAQPATVQRP